MKLALFVLIFIAIYLAALALSALVIMLLTNVVLNYYDIKPLSYGVAVAIAFLLTLLFGGVSQARKN